MKGGNSKVQVDELSNLHARCLFSHSIKKKADKQENIFAMTFKKSYLVTEHKAH